MKDVCFPCLLHWNTYKERKMLAAYHPSSSTCCIPLSLSLYIYICMYNYTHTDVSSSQAPTPRSESCILPSNLTTPICMGKANQCLWPLPIKHANVYKSVKTTSFHSFPTLQPSPELTFLLGQIAPLTHMPPRDLPRPWSPDIPLGCPSKITRKHGSNSSHHEKRQVSKLRRRI